MNWRDLCRSFNLPDEPGIYSVWSGERLLYIGKTERIRLRLLDHNKRHEFRRHKADCIRFVLDDSLGLHFMEKWLINKHRPPLNKMIPSYGL